MRQERQQENVLPSVTPARPDKKKIKSEHKSFWTVCPDVLWLNMEERGFGSNETSSRSLQTSTLCLRVGLRVMSNNISLLRWGKKKSCKSCRVSKKKSSRKALSVSFCQQECPSKERDRERKKHLHCWLKCRSSHFVSGGNDSVPCDDYICVRPLSKYKSRALVHDVQASDYRGVTQM